MKKFNTKPRDALDIQNEEVRDLTVISLANQMAHDKISEKGFRAIKSGEIKTESDLENMNALNKTFGL